MTRVMGALFGNLPGAVVVGGTLLIGLLLGLLGGRIGGTFSQLWKKTAINTNADGSIRVV
jgi:hypothetical protein